MQPISDFDDRFQIIRSLIRRKELPANWYTDDAYSISFETDKNKIVKLIIRISEKTSTIVQEYEPRPSQNGENTSHLFMLKTSEVLQETPEPL